MQTLIVGYELSSKFDVTLDLTYTYNPGAKITTLNPGFGGIV